MDLIDRQAAIDTLKALEESATTAQHLSAIFDCEDAIRDMPSVQPEEDTIEMQEADIDETMKRLRDARVTIPLSVQPVLSDCIRRQAAIDALDAVCDRECEYSKQQRSVMCGACRLGSAFDVIDELPSAEPDPSDVARDIATIIENEKDMRVIAQPVRKGKWVRNIHDKIICNQCGMFGNNEWNLCPNCGASMSEGEKDDCK